MPARWAEVPSAERVGAGDGFSQPGGGSLLAATLRARAAAEFQISPEALVFNEPLTVAGMAVRIEAIRITAEGNASSTWLNCPAPYGYAQSQ